MTILTHAALGGLAGIYSPNIYLSAVLGFVSHFVFDFMPHNDYIYFYFEKRENPYTSWTSRVILFFTLIYLISLFLFQPQAVALKTLVGSLAAMIPDILTGTWSTLGWKSSWFDKIHYLTHKRLTLAEWVYDSVNSQNRLSRKDRLTVNFGKIKNSKMTRLGWGLELLAEFSLLLFCLFRLGLLS